MTPHIVLAPHQRAEARVEALERRIRSFEKRSSGEQRILCALAVFGGPASKTQLLDLCRILEIPDRSRRLDIGTLRPMLKSWAEAGLILSDGTTVCCDVDLATYAIRVAAEATAGSRLAQPAFMRAVLTVGGSWNSNRVSEIRLSRIAGREDEAAKQAAAYLETQDGAFHIHDLFGPGDPWFVPQQVAKSEWLLPACVAGGLALLGDRTWYMVLFDELLSGSSNLESLLLRRDAGSVAKLSQLFRTRGLVTEPSVRSLWYLWQFLLGNADKIQQRAEAEVSSGEPESGSYLALVELLRGNLSSCLERFEDARGPRKANDIAPFQQTWLGAFHVLALLLSGTEPHLQLAALLIKKLVGKGARSANCEVPYAYVWLGRYWQHSTGSPIGVLKAIEHCFEHPVTYLVRLLTCVWTQQSGSEFWASKVELEEVRGRVQALGYGGLELELAAIQERLNASNPTMPVETPHGLVALKRRKEPWESTLDALARIATKENLKTASKEDTSGSHERLAWFVHDYSGRLHVEARLQTKKGAGYGRGRPVALHRLLAPVDTSLPITVADRAVIEHLSVIRHGYGRDEIRFEDGVAAALIGHPNVFDSVDDGIQYQVKRGHLQLRCEQTDSGYRLQFEPPLSKDLADVIQTVTTFVRSGAAEVIVYSITPAIRDVVKMLGAELNLPKVAENQLKALLPRLSSLVPTMASVAAVDGQLTQPGDTMPVMRIRPKAEALRVQLFVTPFGSLGPTHVPGEGSELLMDFRDGQVRQVQRDLPAERQRAMDIVAKLSSLEGTSTDDFAWTTPDLESCLVFMSEVAQLPESDVRVEWPEGQPLRLKRMQNMTVRITGGDAARWFEAEGTVQFSDGAALRIAEILAQLERTTGRFVKLSEGDYAELSRDALQRLELLRSFQVDSGEKERVRVAPWLALAMPESDDSDGQAGDAQWSEWRNRVRQANKRALTPAKAFAGSLRDYQLLGFAWLCRMASLGTGVCLADDMGLGKTVQALAFLQHRARRKPVTNDVVGPMLIVAPASVCPNWLSEAARFTPELEGRWFTGVDRTLESLTRKSLVVCTYDILHRDCDALTKITWDTVVLDEAHNIKNAHTRRAKAAFSLTAGFRLATTGTPIENHLGELWSLFHFLMPDLLGEQHEFVERFRSPIENAKDQGRRKQLQALIRPFVLRRVKSQVLSELPPRTELVRQVQLSEAERELYEAIRQRGLESLRVSAKDGNQQRIRVLAELMRLRRACCHPRLVIEDSELGSSKLSAFLELVTELRDAGHRALVFSQFVDHLSLVREALDDQGVPYLYLDGSTPLGERARRVEAFQRGEGELFLISLRAGGTGLNLTAADYVIHLDPWWNPAVEDQASDRAHRIGQERPVTIYRLVTQGTIEERLVVMHAEKRTLVADILEGTGGTKRFEPDELMNLLREAAIARKTTLRPAK